MPRAVIDIPERLLEVAQSETFQGSFAMDELDAKPDLYRFAAPLAYSVTVSNTGEALVVSGDVRGTGSTNCARCLDDFDVDIEGEVEGYFVLPGFPPPEGMDDDEYVMMDTEDAIDIAPLLEAAVRLDLPLVPLCRPDCKGICPDCGQNLNEAACDCASKRAARDEADEQARNPFAVLKDLDLGN